MGTDIHAAIERRVSNRWRFDKELDLDRDYHLFGILAGVRGRVRESIAEPRGLPADVDPESRDRVWLGDHSYSWLLLSELRAYDWDKQLPDQGLIPLRDVDRSDWRAPFYKETYAEWRASPPHPPKGWCGGTSSAEVLDLRPREFLIGGLSHPDELTRQQARVELERIAVDAAKADRYLADPSLFPEPEEPPPGALMRRPGMTHGWLPGKTNPRTAWAHVAWSLSAKETCPQFYAWLQTVIDLPGEETRLVFGFDS